MAPYSATLFHCMTRLFVQRIKPSCFGIFWILLFTCMTFAAVGPQTKGVTFSGIRNAFQNGSKVGIVFWRQGLPLAIFDFKTQSLSFVEDPLMPKKGPYAVVAAMGEGFTWVYHGLHKNHSFVTDGRGKLITADNFLYIGGSHSRWQVMRLFPTTTANRVFMVLKQWDRNQWRFAKYYAHSPYLSMFHTGEWLPETGIFLDDAQETLIWYNRYTGQIDLYDADSVEHKRQVRLGGTREIKAKNSSGASKFRWRLEAPQVVNGMIFFQQNIFRNDAGVLLPTPKRVAIALDNAEWWEVKLYPLAYYRGQYLAVDRQTNKLGLVSDLNQEIQHPLN